MIQTSEAYVSLNNSKQVRWGVSGGRQAMCTCRSLGNGPLQGALQSASQATGVSYLTVSGRPPGARLIKGLFCIINAWGLRREGGGNA